MSTAPHRRKQAAPVRYVAPTPTKRKLRDATESASKRRAREASDGSAVVAAAAEEANQAAPLLNMPDLVLRHIFPLRTPDPRATRDWRATLKRFALTCRAAYTWAWHERFRDAIAVTINFGVPPIYISGEARSAFNPSLAVRSAALASRPLRLACPRVTTVVFDNRELGRWPTVATWNAMQKLMSRYLRSALHCTQYIELSVSALPRGRFLPLRFPPRCLISFRPSSATMIKRLEYVTMARCGRLDICSPVIQSPGELIFRDAATNGVSVVLNELHLTSYHMEKLVYFMFHEAQLRLRVERMVLVLDNDYCLHWNVNTALTVHTLVTRVPIDCVTLMWNEPFEPLPRSMCYCYDLLCEKRCTEWFLMVDYDEDIPKIQEYFCTQHGARGVVFTEERQADGTVAWRCRRG